MQACSSLTRTCSRPLRACARISAVAAQQVRSRLMPRTAVISRAGKIQKVSDEELEAAIAGRTTNMVVDFYATWCGPCVLLSSELEKVAVELGDNVQIIKVDVDENQNLASQLKIEGLPTMVFIPKDGGKPALRTEGLLPMAQILDILRDL